jgi:hypothetical protein
MLFKNIVLPILSVATGVVCRDHFYTLDPNGELAPGAGYVSEGVAAWVYQSDYTGSNGNLQRQPVYRWYNGNDHFYTNDSKERPGDYTFEKIAFYEPVHSSDPSFVPFNRWYSASANDHFYTTDPNGELAPGSGYANEGNIGLVGKATVNPIPPNTVPLYRWYRSW